MVFIAPFLPIAPGLDAGYALVHIWSTRRRGIIEIGANERQSNTESDLRKALTWARPGGCLRPVPRYDEGGRRLQTALDGAGRQALAPEDALALLPGMPSDGGSLADPSSHIEEKDIQSMEPARGQSAAVRVSPMSA